MKKDNVIFFVDFEYLRIGYREKKDLNLNIHYPSFFNKIANGRNILEIRIYDTDPESIKPDPSTSISSSFLAGYYMKKKSHKILQKKHYTMIFGRIAYHKENGCWIPHQKGVDVRLAVDVYRSIARKWHDKEFTPIIISGDTDYEHVLRLINKDYKKSWELWSYDKIKYFEDLKAKNIYNFFGELKIIDDSLLISSSDKSLLTTPEITAS